MKSTHMKNKMIPILYKRKEECCGCSSCYAICAREAIRMVEDEKGFEYPQIDESKCVRCYQCIKVCPIKEANRSESYGSDIECNS